MATIRKRLTEKQRIFVDIYVSHRGKLSNKECAIKAGYPESSARQRAYKLMNPSFCPHVVEAIEIEREAYNKKYKVDYWSHVAELGRLRDQIKRRKKISWLLPVAWKN